MMNILLRIAGTLLLVSGGVWFFQGINVIPGSFMTGQSKWALYGGITAALGFVLLAVSLRSRS